MSNIVNITEKINYNELFSKKLINSNVIISKEINDIIESFRNYFNMMLEDINEKDYGSNEYIEFIPVITFANENNKMEVKCFNSILFDLITQITYDNVKSYFVVVGKVKNELVNFEVSINNEFFQIDKKFVMTYSTKFGDLRKIDYLEKTINGYELYENYINGDIFDENPILHLMKVIEDKNRLWGRK